MKKKILGIVVLLTPFLLLFGVGTYMIGWAMIYFLLGVLGFFFFILLVIVGLILIDSY